MSSINKVCKPKGCKEPLVHDVACGTRDCMPMKDCAEVVVAEEAPKAEVKK